jgi:uncharacterized protein (DUF2267 family)
MLEAVEMTRDFLHNMESHLKHIDNKDEEAALKVFIQACWIEIEPLETAASSGYLE